MQVYGQDYSDMFSRVAKMAYVRLFAMAARKHALTSVNIKNAFLLGDMEQVIYTEQPPELVAQVCKCKFHKSMYGLKQSPRA